MTRKKIAILSLVFISTFSFVFANFLEKATFEKGRIRESYFEISFDARITNDSIIGDLRNSDGTTGKEVHIPVQTGVHVVAVNKNRDVRVETPITIEMEGESHEVYLDDSLNYVSIDDIDKSSYAEDFLRLKVQENEQNIDLMIRKYLIISTITAVVLFIVFSWAFLLIEKKCASIRKYRILFCCLLFTSVVSLLFMYIILRDFLRL